MQHDAVSEFLTVLATEIRCTCHAAEVCTLQAFV